MADEEKTEETETAAPEGTEAEPKNDDAAGDTPRESADAAAAVAVDAEPEVQLSPKERRRQKRGAHTGEAKAPRTVEERIADRAEDRKRKAAERRRYRSGRGKVRADAVEKGDGTPAAEYTPGNPKVRQGIVVSDKMDKTITVRVESARRHPTYEKVIRTSKMYHAHDESNEAGAGDTVRLTECRPMSKTKHWRLTEILEKAK
jgi:small subunit ribosomal protein S17